MRELVVYAMEFILWIGVLLLPNIAYAQGYDPSNVEVQLFSVHRIN